MLLAVYLIKAVVDPLRVFATNYYNKYPKLGKMVLNLIKAAQMKENQFVAVRIFSLRPFFLLKHQIIIKSALTWLEYTNKNLWGGESPTSSTKYGLAITFKH